MVLRFWLVQDPFGSSMSNTYVAKRCVQSLLELKTHMTSSWVNSSRRLRYPSWKSLSPKRNARENIEAPETMTKLKEKAKETWICVRFSQLSTKHVFKEESHIENILKVCVPPNKLNHTNWVTHRKHFKSFVHPLTNWLFCKIKPCVSATSVS